MGLLDFFKKRLAPAPEEKKEEVIIASPIDYSAVPFQLEQPLTTEDNRRVLNQCMDTMNRLLKLARRESRNSHRFCDPFRGSDFYRRALHLPGEMPEYKDRQGSPLYRNSTFRGEAHPGIGGFGSVQRQDFLPAGRSARQGIHQLLEE